MADIAVVFGWAPEAMEDLTLGDLYRWHHRAVARAPLKGLSHG